VGAGLSADSLTRQAESTRSLYLEDPADFDGPKRANPAGVTTYARDSSPGTSRS
jgi:hypothetical protein